MMVVAMVVTPMMVGTELVRDQKGHAPPRFFSIGQLQNLNFVPKNLKN